MLFVLTRHAAFIAGFDEQPSQSEVIPTPAITHARLRCAIVMHTLPSADRGTLIAAVPTQSSPAGESRLSAR